MGVHRPQTDAAGNITTAAIKCLPSFIIAATAQVATGTGSAYAATTASGVLVSSGSGPGGGHARPGGSGKGHARATGSSKGVAR